MSARRLGLMAERAARTGAAMAERGARPVAAEREDLRGRVIREDEWLDPGLARRRAAGAASEPGGGSDR